MGDWDHHPNFGVGGVVVATHPMGYWVQGERVPMNIGEVKVKMYDNGTALVQWCDSSGNHSKILQPGDTFSADFGIKNWAPAGD